MLVARDPTGPGENKAALRAAVAMIFSVSIFSSFPSVSFIFSLLHLLLTRRSLRSMLRVDE